MESLSIKIDGEGELADFEDFAIFAKAVAQSLTTTHRRLYPERQKRPRFNVVALNVGSATAAIAPAQASVGIFEPYVQTLVDIRRGELPQGKLSSEDVRTYRKLGTVLDSHTRTAYVGGVAITRSFVANCDQLIDAAPHAFGDVVGRLQGVNSHKSNRFWLYTQGSDVGAECFVSDPDLYQRMMGMFDGRVRLTGKIRRNPDGVGVDRVDVADAERLPEAGEVPTLASLAGIWKRDQPLNLDEMRSSWNE